MLCHCMKAWPSSLVFLGIGGHSMEVKPKTVAEDHQEPPRVSTALVVSDFYDCHWRVNVVFACPMSTTVPSLKGSPLAAAAI